MNSLQVETISIVLQVLTFFGGAAAIAYYGGRAVRGLEDIAKRVDELTHEVKVTGERVGRHETRLAVLEDARRREEASA